MGVWEGGGGTNQGRRQKLAPPCNFKPTKVSPELAQQNDFNGVL